VENLKLLTLLLHDERFSGWRIKDKLVRQHFSLQYLHFCRRGGWEPLLYTFHQEAKAPEIHKLNDGSVVKIFPVKFRFPPFQLFGNDHNPQSVMREALMDKPDLVHFHNYYLFSYPYTAIFVKRKLKCPLIVQLHSYNDSLFKKGFYLPNLLALRNADRIVYSYEPEKILYKRLGVLQKAVKVPTPGFDPQIFKRQRRCSADRLLYVGRIPRPEMACGEKSPLLLIRILRCLLRRSKDTILDVVGDGPGFHRCFNLAYELGVEDHVSFHGYVPYNELPKYYQAAALTFSPIRICDVDGWFDGSIQESLACGTPVAAFKASPETPLYGTYGFLLSSNVEKAATEVTTLLKRQEELDQVAEEGSRFVHENCSNATVSAELQKNWEDVIQA
jgi:glycosyltransferase involved in cell wall biosynthesis